MNAPANINTKPAILPTTMPAMAPFESCDFCLFADGMVALEEDVVLVLALVDVWIGIVLSIAVNNVVENGVGSAMHFH
jgi:hypothetical protein